MSKLEAIELTSIERLDRKPFQHRSRLADPWGLTMFHIVQLGINQTIFIGTDSGNETVLEVTHRGIGTRVYKPRREPEESLEWIENGVDGAIVPTREGPVYLVVRGFSKEARQAKRQILRNRWIEENR